MFVVQLASMLEDCASGNITHAFVATRIYLNTNFNQSSHLESMSKAGITIFGLVDNLWHDPTYGFGSFNGLRIWTRLVLAVRTIDNSIVRFL